MERRRWVIVQYELYRATDGWRVGLSGYGYRSLRMAVVLSTFIFFSGKPELLLVVVVVVGGFVSRVCSDSLLQVFCS